MAEIISTSEHDQTSTFYTPDKEDARTDTGLQNIGDSSTNAAAEVEREFVNAKAFLLQSSTVSGLNMYARNFCNYWSYTLCRHYSYIFMLHFVRACVCD